MNKVELLAPAGTKEAFIHAINAGANAIFMAGQKFGARAFATNFTVEDIIDAIAYAHLRHVLVYITINTLTFDDEIEDLLAYTDDLVKHHVDALIVQDIGVMALLIQRYPNTAIHASTQVNAHHVSQVKFLKSLGVKRVILARETNLQTIKEIKKAVDIELEVFIHGALCISYSGNCLMSSILNHRSGNRGSCAYSCRLPYQLLEENKVISDKTYLLSAKDLMTLEYIDELIEAGIDSFKIEGRMRKETYVSQTVAIYRKSMEAYNQQKTLDLTHDIDLLKRVFNRAYTKGYMFDEIPKDINNDFRPNHIGINIGKVIDYKQSYALIQLTESLENGDGFRIIGDHDYGNIVTFMKNTNDEVVKKALLNDQVWLKIKERVSIGDLVYKTLDAALEKSLSVFSDENYKLIPLKGYVKAFRGDYLSFYLTDDDGHEVSVISANPLDAANRRPLLKIDLIKQFSKFGDTPFYINQLEIFTDEQSFMSMGEMNSIRNEAIEKLINAIIYRDQPVIESCAIISNFNDTLEESLVVKVHQKEQLEVAIDLGIKEIYYDEYLEPYIPKLESIKFYPVRQRIIQAKSYPIVKDTVVNELGALYENANKFNLIGDEFLNITNIYSAALISNYNVKRLTLSAELDKNHILNFSKKYYEKFKQYPNIEMVIYGYKDLMISKYCPVAKTFGYKPNCQLCNQHQYYLKNDEKQTFALINDGQCNMRVMDTMPYVLIDEIEVLRQANIKTFRLDFTLESKVQTTSIIKAYQNAMNHLPYVMPKIKSRKGNLSYSN